MKYELILKLPQGQNGPAIGSDTASEAIRLLESGAELSEIGRLIRPAAQAAPQQTAAVSEAAETSGAAMEPGTALAQTPAEAPKETETAAKTASHASELNQLSLDDKPLTARLAKADSGEESIELSISFELKEGAFDAVFCRAMGFADLLGASVTDPQLMLDITAASQNQVSAKWSEMREYLLRATGRSALLMSNNVPLTMPAPTFFERHWKGIFIGIGIILLLMLVRRSWEILSAVGG